MTRCLPVHEWQGLGREHVDALLRGPPRSIVELEVVRGWSELPVREKVRRRSGRRKPPAAAAIANAGCVTLPQQGSSTSVGMGDELSPVPEFRDLPPPSAETSIAGDGTLSEPSKGVSQRSSQSDAAAAPETEMPWEVGLGGGFRELPKPSSVSGEGSRLNPTAGGCTSYVASERQLSGLSASGGGGVERSSSGSSLRLGSCASLAGMRGAAAASGGVEPTGEPAAGAEPPPRRAGGDHMRPITAVPSAVDAGGGFRDMPPPALKPPASKPTPATGGSSSGGSDLVARLTRQAERLRSKVEALEAALEVAREEALAHGRVAAEARGESCSLRAEADHLRSELEDRDERLRRLNVEEVGGGGAKRLVDELLGAKHDFALQAERARAEAAQALLRHQALQSQSMVKEQLICELDEAREKLQGKVEQDGKVAEDLRVRVHSLEGELEQRLRNVMQQLIEVVGRNESLSDENRHTLEQIKALTSQLQDERMGQEALDQELGHRTIRLSECEQRLTEFQRVNDQLRGQLGACEAELGRSEQELRRLQGMLEAAEAAQREWLDAAHRQHLVLQSQMEAVEAALRELTQAQAVMAVECTQLSDKVQQLQVQVAAA